MPLLLALLLTLIPARAEPSAQEQDWGSWQEARSYYDGGKFEEALHSLRSHPSSDPAYFYNLGTVHYRLGQYGSSVAYFEKASRLKAHDGDIKHNLDMARDSLSRIIGKDRLDPASSPIETFADGLPLDEIRGVIGLFSFMLSLAWIRAFRKTRSLARTLFQPTGVLGLVALSSLAGLYGAQRLAQRYPPAACLEAQVVRSGPGDQFIELGRVEPGMKVRLLGPSANSSTTLAKVTPPVTGGDPAGGPADAVGTSEAWRQVRYSADGIGWVRSSSLLLL